MTTDRRHRTADELFPLYGPNIYPAAHPVIRHWDELMWHRRADSPRSSQALAIDVFGTIRQSPHAGAVLEALARELGLPDVGPWGLSLEVVDRDNTLHEIQPTPIDVLLSSPQALILIECKFAEQDGGRCQQTRRAVAPPQCNGNYAWQTNPRNGLAARCALTAKGMRYWEYVPQLFNIRADVDQIPCPFAGPWYQWMRNLAVGKALADASGRIAAFVVVYVERRGLPMARHDWAPLRQALRPGSLSFHTLTFQRVLALAAAAAPQDPVWPDLTAWVEDKIRRA